MAAIPTCPEQLTTQWMAEVLAEAFPGAELSDCQLIEANSGTTGRARVALTWADDTGKDLPARAFLKIVPTNPVQAEINSQMAMGKREAIFYKQLAAEIPVRHPRAYYSDWSDNGDRYVMVMEDLESSGGRPAKLPVDHDYAYAEQMIDALAALHAKYWDTERFDTDLNWLAHYWPARAPQIPSLVDRSSRFMADLLPPVLMEARDLFVNHQTEVCDLFDRGTPTLVHGDGHMSNMFFDAQGQLGFLDWAIVSKMPAMWDVSMLVISFPPEVRRKIEQHLLPRYIEQLSAHGGPELELDQVFREYRKYAFFPWISATTTLGAIENMQPIEWGLAAARWTTQALEELDVVPLIREELGL